MPSTPSADHDPAEHWGPFVCRWRLEGREAASVRVCGEVDLATAPQLDATLHEALVHARLVVLDLHEMPFMDSSGLHAILNAASRARAQGARIVLVGASAQVESLLDVTRTRAQLDLLEGWRPGEPSRVDHADRNGWTPFDNPVNERVLLARVMAVSDADLWVQAADGTIHRPWAPPAGELPVPTGSAVELYLDAAGTVNGWYEPRSGLAINQRCLDLGETPASDLACTGPCGLVWLAPAAARLAEREERCLTCAGPLARR